MEWMDGLERSIGVQIKNAGLYREALTHKSAVRFRAAAKSNERMEFLGDSVLSLVITKYLYDRYPEASEGLLTRLRTKIVSGTMLSKLSEKLGLHDMVMMNARAQTAGWNHNSRIKEDLFEAIVGAIYLDHGLPAARDFIIRLLEENVDWRDVHEDTNYKDALMRTTQFMSWELPTYCVVGTSGPDHSKRFTVKVLIQGREVGTGTANSKKNAEQHAAKRALDTLNIQLPATNSSYS